MLAAIALASFGWPQTSMASYVPLQEELLARVYALGSRG